MTRNRVVLALVAAFWIGTLFPVPRAAADGGLTDSAHRMAVALERIASWMERR